jgi:glucose-1-phosphate adenylyltransferase
LIDALDNSYDDFGKHIIPASLKKYKVFAYIFQGYWEDIGTVRAFFEANLALSDTVPPYNFFDHLNPIYTHARFLPASKINVAQINRAIIGEGCIITHANIERAVIGIRIEIETGTTNRNSVLMGADFYQDEYPSSPGSDCPPLGIGPNCVIDGAIIDKNARIGNDVVISPAGKPEKMDGHNFYIRDGVVVVPTGAVIPPGTKI